MLIAEVGHNHNGDMSIAKELIRCAKNSGADVVKFQLYDIDKIVPLDHEWYWDLQRGQVSWSQWLEIVDECNRLGIEFMASAFDVERVGWCEEVGMKRYKVASRSIYNEELLEAIVQTGKDVLISLGKVNGRGIPKLPPTTKVGYLYCIAKYPVALAELKLGKVDWNKYAGFSDHTMGIEAAMVAISRGADIIEKHFTLSRAMDGCDHAGSMEPDDLAKLYHFANKVREMA